MTINAPQPAGMLDTKVLSTVSGLPGAEITAFDPASGRAFVTSGSGVQVVNLSKPLAPVTGPLIDPMSFGLDSSAVTSVAISNGILAVAVPAADKTQPGTVLLFDAQTLALLSQTQVGALPDMLTFTPDGTKVLVANEGEPGAIDPAGSVSIIDISAGAGSPSVTTAGFGAFDAMAGDLQAAGLRLFPGVQLSLDVEPEYIAIDPNGLVAYVTLQEANAVAVLDLATSTFTEIRPLPGKDHSLPGNELDVNDRDQAPVFVSAPVTGLLMPDGIASFSVGGETFYITANEGDDRGENVRISTLDLDESLGDEAALKALYGRLAVSSIDGDTDGDGDYDQLFSYGGRSFTIFDSAGNRVFDSGSDLERIIAEQTPSLHNADESDPAEIDTRSDAKGPEPESVTTGVIDGRTYAFIAIERAGGGVMVYDITEPRAPTFDQYLRINGDIAPEGLKFVAASESPNGAPLLLVSNEVSNTLSIYQLRDPLIEGTNARDDLRGTSADEEFAGLAGDDLIRAFGGDDLVKAGNGDDTVFGGDGVDTINGGAGRDTLQGQAGNDVLAGGLGNDRLFGGAGDDRLAGGEGADSFFFTAADGAASSDIVADFELGIDKLVLRALNLSDISDSAAGAIVSFDNGADLLLRGIAADDLTSDSFSFQQGSSDFFVV